MKKMILFASLVSAVAGVQAQGNHDLKKILSAYYAVKNSLVAAEAGKASTLAAEMVVHINNTDLGKLNADEKKAFLSVKTKLLADAQRMADSKDLAAQRLSFSSLSESMMTLVKNTRMSEQPVYIDYCPMKKSYWLSAEKEIKNPYYGSSMLTCGSVKETIQ